MPWLASYTRPWGHDIAILWENANSTTAVYAPPHACHTNIPVTSSASVRLDTNVEFDVDSKSLPCPSSPDSGSVGMTVPAECTARDDMDVPCMDAGKMLHV